MDESKPRVQKRRVVNPAYHDASKILITEMLDAGLLRESYTKHKVALSNAHIVEKIGDRTKAGKHLARKNKGPVSNIRLTIDLSDSNKLICEVPSYSTKSAEEISLIMSQCFRFATLFFQPPYFAKMPVPEPVFFAL